MKKILRYEFKKRHCNHVDFLFKFSLFEICLPHMLIQNVKYSWKGVLHVNLREAGQNHTLLFVPKYNNIPGFTWVFPIYLLFNLLTFLKCCATPPPPHPTPLPPSTHAAICAYTFVDILRKILFLKLHNYAKKTTSKT